MRYDNLIKEYQQASSLNVALNAKKITLEATRDALQFTLNSSLYFEAAVLNVSQSVNSPPVPNTAAIIKAEPNFSNETTEPKVKGMDTVRLNLPSNEYTLSRSSSSVKAIPIFTANIDSKTPLHSRASSANYHMVGNSYRPTFFGLSSPTKSTPESEKILGDAYEIKSEKILDDAYEINRGGKR